MSVVLAERGHDDERERHHVADGEVEGIRRQRDEEGDGKDADDRLLRQHELDAAVPVEEGARLGDPEEDHEGGPQIQRAEAIEAEPMGP